MLVSKGPYCSAVNCSNSRGKNPELSFFTFPGDPERSRKWVINCQRVDLLQKTSEYLRKNFRLCASHFEENQFMNTNRNSLIKTAVPTIFTKSNCPEQLSHRKQQSDQTFRLKSCDGNSNRGTEEVAEMEMQLTMNTESKHVLCLYDIISATTLTKKGRMDLSTKRVTNITQDKNNFQEEPPAEDEEAVDYDQFVDQCVILPIIVEKEGTVEEEIGECIDNKKGVGQHSVEETEEVKEFHSLVHKNSNISKEVNAGERIYEQDTTSSNQSIMLDEQLPSSALLKQPTPVAMDMNQYQGNVCGKTFTQQHCLPNYKLMNNNIQKYQCNICNATFTKSGYLSKHQLLCGVRQYWCYMCNITFTNFGDFHQHKLMHASDQTYQCDICNKTFTNSKKLLQHKFIHSEKYKCDICNKAFTCSRTLIKHKLMHADSRKYQCNVCNKSFTRSYNFSEHKLIHTNVKKYQCNVCNKRFTHSRYLLKHKRNIHTRNKKYRCDV